MSKWPSDKIRHSHTKASLESPSMVHNFSHNGTSHWNVGCNLWTAIGITEDRLGKPPSHHYRTCIIVCAHLLMWPLTPCTLHKTEWVLCAQHKMITRWFEVVRRRAGMATTSDDFIATRVASSDRHWWASCRTRIVAAQPAHIKPPCNFIVTLEQFRR